MGRSKSPDVVSDILAHHGIKGMKWGVRKDRSESRAAVARSTKGHENEASDDAKRANANNLKARTKGTASLSNKDLQDLVNRMNLEQQYSTLESKRPTAMSKGQSIVKKTLSLGQTVNNVIAFANSPAGKALKASLGK